MNLLVILARECNPIIGGIERVTYTLTKYWEQRGIQVFWLAVENSRWLDASQDVDEKQFFLPNSQLLASKENEAFLKTFIEDKKIDIILNQATIVPGVVALCNHVKSQKGVKLVSSIHFAPWTEYDIAKNNLFLFRDNITLKSLLWKVLEWLYFYLYGGHRIKNNERRIISNICTCSDKVIFLSNSYLPEFARMVNNGNFSSITNPIEGECLNKLPNKRKILLYVARLEYGMKRFDRALRIWERLYSIFPDWEFIVVGDGDYRMHFEKLSRDWNIERIKFFGFQNPEPYFRDSSLLCLTSTTEGFGMVLVEAMQYGCVPVAYNSYTALSDIIDDGVNGYKVTAFKEDEFVKKLSSLMSDDMLREKMAENALKTPQKFDASIIADQWIKLFESLMK